MKFWLVTLAAALAVAAAAAPAPKDKKPAADGLSKETRGLVDYVLKTPTADLTESAIPAFMELDPKALPAPLGPRVQAKQAELNALRSIAESRKKPPIRRAGQEEDNLCPREEGSMQFVKALAEMGFEEITDDEERFLLKRTKCTECELQEEFTLKIVITPPEKKGGKHRQHLFLSQSDPLMALVAKYRDGSAIGTDFFGAFAGACH